jgi:hypothetical protein
MSFGVYSTLYGTTVPAGTSDVDVTIEAFTGIHVFVGGKEYTSKLNGPSFNVRDELGERNTASFTLKAISTEDAVHFKVGEPVSAVLNSLLVFAGVIESTTERVLGETQLAEIAVRCVDYNALADRHIVAARFTAANQTLFDVVSSVLNVHSGDLNEQLGYQNPTTHTGGDGVMIMGDSVQTGPVLQTLGFAYKTVKEVFDELAELTGYWWGIDYHKVLYFVDRKTFAAPRVLDPSVWTGYAQGSSFILVKRARGDYRNIQILRAGKDQTDPESQQQVFIGDGEKTDFRLKLEVVVPSVNGVEKPPRFEVDTGSGYVAKTAGIQQRDKNKDWYYEVGSKDVSQDSAGTKLAAGHKLRVTYTGSFPLVVSGRDDAEIRSRAAIEQTTGTQVQVEEDEKIDDGDLAEEKVQALLRRFARIPDTVEFECYEPGFQSGQLLQVNLPEFAIQGEFLIDSVEMRWHADGPDGNETYKYSVSATSGEFLGGWADFFRKQASKGRPFVLRENEVILLLRQIAEPLNVTDTATTASPLGTMDDDPYSVLTVGGQWVGGVRFKSATDTSPGIYYGSSVGFPLHSEQG